MLWDLFLPSSPSLFPASIPCPRGEVSLLPSRQGLQPHLSQGLLQLVQAGSLPSGMQVLLRAAWPGSYRALGGEPQVGAGRAGRELRLSHCWDPHPRLIPGPGESSSPELPAGQPGLTSPSCRCLTPCASLPLPWRGQTGTAGWEFSLRFSSWRRGWEMLFRAAHMETSHLKVQGVCGIWGLGSSSALALLQLLSQPDPVPGSVQVCTRQPQCCG